MPCVQKAHPKSEKNEAHATTEEKPLRRTKTVSNTTWAHATKEQHAFPDAASELSVQHIMPRYVRSAVGCAPCGPSGEWMGAAFKDRLVFSSVLNISEDRGAFSSVLARSYGILNSPGISWCI